MILKNKNERTLLVLGAGATRGALASATSPRIYPPLNRDYFAILEKYVNTKDGARHRTAYKRLKEFIDKEVGQKGISRPQASETEKKKSKEPTMEEVFNVLFMSKDLPKIFHKSRGRKRDAGFRPEIKDFLTLLVTIFRYLQDHCHSKDGLHHHQVIARALRPHDTIMTLNYDTYMDNALILEGWNPRSGYGFSAKVVPHGQIRPPRTYSKALQHVLLLKPHGSFNWWAKGSFNRLEEVLQSRPVSQVEVSNKPRIYEFTNKRLVRFFIPPLYTKFFRNKFWTKLWFNAYDAARKADRIIIIGCSLIATDYHLRAILAKAMTERKKYKEVIIVDRSPNTRTMLKQFFRGRSEKGFREYNTFSEFIEGEFKWQKPKNERKLLKQTKNVTQVQST